MGTLVDAYSSFNWLDGLGRGHPSAMKEHPVWAFAGVGSDLAGLMQGAAAAGEALGASRLAAAANTPVILVGLVTMMGMANSCGFGEPNNGWQFASGAEGFKKAADALRETKPPDSWLGDASDTYGKRNEEHQQRVAAIAEVDKAVKDALADEAHQNNSTRGTLDHTQTILGLSIPIAMGLYFVPEIGPALSMICQVGAVGATMPNALLCYRDLIANVQRNSSAIEKAGARYSELASNSKA
ncbi:EspA/EspE family type VII secretion system effector [Mycolicibacterium sp. CBMA 361]|uniref:EspA/EspE family type VII secretion system effector n=1 Tax=Mycolicibacterium sp. CBMA 361 TaxID=2606610 RepID=UPI0012DDFD1D|nr:hypothetical protein [Mycolicibacterium sp. CBMA 361]